MKTKNATMQDVADLAKVSKTTVSHVINETRPVSEGKRQRVLYAMKELDYQPNILARSLRKRETGTIGLIVPNNANPFYAEVSRGVESLSFEEGYNVILCNSDRNLQKEIAYTELLVSKRVDGILFVGAWVGEQTQHLSEINRQGIPLAVVDRFASDLDIDLVRTDNHLGGWLATSHLLGLGHKRISCIGGIPEFTPNAERIIGYKKALRDAGIAIKDEIIIRTNFQFEGGHRAAQQLLSLENRPTAIFACNDLMAIGAMRAARDLGFRIPEDISVVGFDDIQMAQYTCPQLTTIAQPMFDMGKLATEMLLERIRDTNIPQRKRILEPKLVVRQSTSKFPRE
jgi:LacI family transcriptional regulator